jgi:cyclopropane fatty-acyl-phospholipid synthase-like methyltransferase
MKIIDLPCGQGGMSVPLAQKYGVRVSGYDITAAYVRYANEYAREKGVDHLCKYRLKDMREVAKQKDIGDALLWIAPPHAWGKSKATIQALRNPVKNNGIIVIADIYLYPHVKNTGQFKEYETLDSTRRGYTAFGDKVIIFEDYKSSLWEYDYNMTRGFARRALEKLTTDKEREIVQRYLATLEDMDEIDKMGAAIWCIRVNK